MNAQEELPLSNGHDAYTTPPIVMNISGGKGAIATPRIHADNDADINIKLNALALWMKILNARLLAGGALLGALGVFGFALAQPDPLRLWGASLYAIGVLWPVMWLFSKKG